MSRWQELEKHLDYAFKSPVLLEQALTHSSVGMSQAGRLEFLGDAVLGLVVAQYVYETFLGASEGELSRQRAALVKKDSLASLAKAIKLDKHMILGASMRPGHISQAMLSDMFESVLAAVYLDSGLEQCKRVVLQLLKKHMVTFMHEAVSKDAKTQLQEWCHANQLPLPCYRATFDEGNQQVTVTVDEHGHRFSATRATKRAAEQAVALELVTALKGKKKIKIRGEKND